MKEFHLAFEIHKIDRKRAQHVEPLGSKPKFWFRQGEKRLLFKADDRGTGEDWAEVVSCHLCQLLGLPHVKYFLAAEYDGEEYRRPGVICENMSPPSRDLQLGNQLLLDVDPTYPSSRRFRVKQHTVDAVCEVLRLVFEPAEEWMCSVPAILTSLDVFIGYVMLDAWIANQDRHHENWGAILLGPDHFQLQHLAPTFDHGAAMARQLLDDERQERMTTKDANRSLDAFVRKGRSAFYESANSAKPLLLIDTFQRFGARSPRAARIWIERLRAIDRVDVTRIIEQIPESRMSGVCREFTTELLERNRRRLLELEWNS